MSANFSLGRILGIPVGVSYSWFVILALVSYIVFGQLSSQFPQWGMFPLAGMAAATALLFFVSVLAHELAHSLMATRHSISVRGITLFLLGGVSHISREAKRPWTEFIVAFVGPAMSFALSGLLMGFALYVAPALLEGRLRDGVIVVALLLGWTNLALGVFNLLPGFPLDGGRVLRAGIWGLTGNYWLATGIAVLVGQLFAVALALFSVYLFLQTGNVLTLWPILIGAFVFFAAESARRTARDHRRLTGVTVGEVASAGMLPVGAAVAYAIRARLVRGVPRDAASPVRPMDPLSSFPSIDAGEPALEALELLDEDAGPPCLVVVDGGRVVGIVTHGDLYDCMRARRALDTVS